MSTQIRLSPGAQFTDVTSSEPKSLYIAAFARGFELAVGFGTPPTNHSEHGRGLLYLSGDRFGQIVLFNAEWKSEIPSIKCSEVKDGWDALELLVLTEGALEPKIGGLGILAHRTNISVCVRLGDGNRLDPLFVDLHELRLHPSREKFTTGFTYCGVTHPILKS